MRDITLLNNDKVKQLCLAAKSGNLKKIKSYLSQKKYINVINEGFQNGFGVLHYAACVNTENLELLDYLLKIPELDLTVTAGKNIKRNAADYADFKGKYAAARKIRRVTFQRYNNFSDTNDNVNAARYFQSLPESYIKDRAATLSLMLNSLEPNKVDNALHTRLFRYPQVYISLLKKHRISPISNILLIGPGAYKVMTSLDGYDYITPQYVLLAALFPNAKFTIIEPDENIFNSLKDGKFFAMSTSYWFDATLSVNNFIFDNNSFQKEDFEQVISLIRQGLKDLNAHNLGSAITKRVVFSDTLEEYSGPVTSFDAIVATNSIQYSILNDPNLAPFLLKKMHSLLAQDGEIYIDQFTYLKMEEILGENISDNWKSVSIGQPYKRLSQTEFLDAEPLFENLLPLFYGRGIPAYESYRICEQHETQILYDETEIDEAELQRYRSLCPILPGYITQLKPR